MDSDRPAETGPSSETADFVRFCYRRRRAGWPELYDEMCAVASRGHYKGWGFTELSDHGIGFSLFETPALAALAREVVRQEIEERNRVTAAAATVIPSNQDRRDDAEAASSRGEPVVRLVALGAGAS
jgi:hypothetical protein